MKLALMIGAVLALTACSQGQADKVASPDVVESPYLDVLKKYPVALAEITPDVWVHSSNYTLPGQKPISSNGLVVIDGESLTLVDGAWGELATVNLIKTVQEKFDKPVTKMVFTHYHMDRIAGVDAAEAMGIEVFAHPETPRLAAENGYPVPNTTVAGLKEPGSRAKAGAIEIAYPGAAHSLDNLVVYVPSAQVLYGGCAVKGAGSKGMGYTGAADMKAWPDSLNWIKATYPNTAIVVPGHGKGADLSLIDATLALIAKEVNASGDTP